MNPFGIKIMSYVNILPYYTLVWLDVKNGELFFKLGKIDCISHFVLISSQMLSYVNLISMERSWHRL